MVARLALALALAGVLLPPHQAAAGTKPALSLAPTTGGAVVRGWAFRPREAVRVVLTIGGRQRVARVRASAAGRFTVRYAGVAVDACTTWRLTARGSLGSRATLLPRTARDCPPPPPPG